MDFLLKVLYYGVSAVGVLVFGLFFFGNLMDSSNPADTWVSRAVLIFSGVTGLSFLGWSFVAGHMGEQWVVGIGLAVAGMVVFGVMMLAGMLMFTNVKWN